MSLIFRSRLRFSASVGQAKKVRAFLNKGYQRIVGAKKFLPPQFFLCTLLESPSHSTQAPGRMTRRT